MSRDNEVIFYTDGRHTSVYIYEPPMDPRVYTGPIDELVDLGIDTLSYAVGDCRVLLYDTRAGERWGHNVWKTHHLIWYRAGRNLERFIADGHDPLRVVCDRAHELGFTFVPSLLLCMDHQERVEVTDCRCSDFCFDHPEYQVGPEPDFPEARWDSYHQVLPQEAVDDPDGQAERLRRVMGERGLGVSELFLMHFGKPVNSQEGDAYEAARLAPQDFHRGRHPAVQGE